MDNQIVLMNRNRIDRTLKRMAIQVWERLKEEDDTSKLVLIGLNERGFATASKIADSLAEIANIEVNPVQYNVHDKAANRSLPDCNEKFVLLIDDVIFSGKTMFSALSAVCNLYEPATIEIATLIDRGHRKYPLGTDLKGITVPTKLGEHIEVILDKGVLDQAVLFKNQ
jgi:pyrimidine operon attenuation protein/uracil phosphoribosyltransferase